MTKFRILLIIVFSIAGSIYFLQVSNLEELKNRNRETGSTAVGTVVYANRDMSSGTIFTEKDAIEKGIKLHKIPKNSLRGSSIGKGRTVKSGLKKGQLITNFDFDPPVTKSSRLYVRARNSIPKGKTITLDDVVFGKGRVFLPLNAVEYVSEAIGYKPTKDIPNGSIITLDDLSN